jgi:hypothetical protein
MNIKDKLAEPEVLKKIGKLYSSGMSYAGIAQKLREEDGIDCLGSQVRKVHSIYQVRSQEIIAGDEELKNEIKETVLNTKKQLKEINKLVWELIEKARAEGKLNLENAIPAVREIRTQLELQEKLLSRMEEGVDFRNMNKIQMTQIIIENLQVLERDGYIRILNNPGEIIDLEKLKKFDEGK